MKHKEPFYHIGMEIPRQQSDRYRCLDAKTKSVLQKSQFRISIIVGCLLVLFSILIGRLFYLTVMNYHPKSFKPSVLKTEYILNRKRILDRNGVVLAMTLPTTNLYVNPHQIDNPDETARQLMSVFPEMSYDELYKKLSAPENFRYIKHNLTPKELQRLQLVGNPYLKEEKQEKRSYPHGRLFAHVLGGVDLDNNGTAGLELAYDDILAQEDVVLSLDATVQGIVHQTLKEQVAKYQARWGSGIVTDVTNGEVLAMVSLPDYDPEKPADPKALENRFNRASLGTYELGSVFKLFNTAMALESGLVKPTDMFDATENSLKIGKKVIEDFRGENRPLMVPEILMHSSNIGSSRVALQVGWEKQRAFLKKMGFYDKLDISLPERGRPQYPPEDRKWPDITSATVAYGYGISVTPLHLIAGVGALVNGGYYYVPTFIKGENQDKVKVQVIDEHLSEIMRHMMWAVINYDVKDKNDVYRYSVGGKTGSANLRDEQTNKQMQGRVRVSFIGVFPIEKPKYAVFITMEDPKKLAENHYFNNAGWTAKPAGLSIIEQIAPHLNIEPRETWKQPAYIEKAIQNTKEHQKK